MRLPDDVAAVLRRIADIEGPAAQLPATGVDPQNFTALIDANAAKWGVDAALLRAIVANESGFDPSAASPAGAQGLMQLEPGTAADLGVTNPWDPAQNLAGGTRYFRGLLDRFHGNVRLALAAYNAGPGAIEKYGGLPPYAETRAYVEHVLASYRHYKDRQR